MADDEDHANRGLLLVPLEISRAKFNEQMRWWHQNAQVYAGRGWLLLSEGDLTVDIGMLRTLPMGEHQVPVMTVCVRLDYWNFDLWAPSVTFIDPVTRRPAKPFVRALDPIGPQEAHDLLIDVHPTTRQPFVCLPGVREYHLHPQHSGDDWLLHRQRGRGDLAVICERMWMLMARSVLGVEFGAKLQQIAVGNQMNTAHEFQLTFVQGNADAAEQQLAEAVRQQQLQVLAQAAYAAQNAGEGASQQTGEDTHDRQASRESIEPRARSDSSDQMKAHAGGPDTRS